MIFGVIGFAIICFGLKKLANMVELEENERKFQEKFEGE